MVTNSKLGKGVSYNNLNKKDRGFTLIELLAVIVILVVIALIATPIILNMIENARKSASIDSTYGYIEAIENYQAMSIVKENSELVEGQYNVSTKTIINGKQYNKLNEIIKIKGNKPTGGTINITRNKTVGTATLCINNYVVEYQNNEARIINDDCGEMGLIIDYGIDSEKWEQSKKLTIMYPTEEYERYFKVESGSATLNGEEIELNKEIKVENKSIEITLNQNSKVTYWMIKKGKKISIRTYEEKMIDNVEIGKPEIIISGGYPLLTAYGVESSIQLELSYEAQDGTTPYYSIDDGKTWNKYTKKININVSKVKAKLVRDKSKREGEIVENTGSSSNLPSDALGPEAYDGDDTKKFIIGSASKVSTAYIDIDESLYNKEIFVNYTFAVATSLDKTAYFNWVDSEGNETEAHTRTFGSKKTYSYEVTFRVPEGTKRLKMTKSGALGNSTLYINEIRVNDIPSITSNTVYPVLKYSGIVPVYDNVTINYFPTSVQKLYKIGEDGEWKPYENKEIRVNMDETIFAKGINKNGNDSMISSYTPTVPVDTYGLEAYDKIIESYVSLSGSSTNYMNVDSSMYNKNITIKYYYKVATSYDKTLYIRWLNKDDEVIETPKTLTLSSDNRARTEEFITKVPEGAVKLQTYRTGAPSSSTLYIYEISLNS